MRTLPIYRLKGEAVHRLIPAVQFICRPAEILAGSARPPVGGRGEDVGGIPPPPRAPPAPRRPAPPVGTPNPVPTPHPARYADAGGNADTRGNANAGSDADARGNTNPGGNAGTRRNGSTGAFCPGDNGYAAESKYRKYSEVIPYGRERLCAGTGQYISECPGRKGNLLPDRGNNPEEWSVLCDRGRGF